LDLQQPVQSVLITAKVVSSNLVHGEVCWIQHYVIKFVSVLRQVSGFSPGLPVSSTNKTDLHDIAEITTRELISKYQHHHIKNQHLSQSIHEN
jgi:hypothetical protein